MLHLVIINEMNKEVIILELASFIRSLDFIQEEQAFIKTKLTDQLDSANDVKIISWIEDVHQQIINRELAIQILKKDVQILDRILKAIPGNKTIEEAQFNLFKNTKQQVKYLEHDFFSWKNNINHQLELTNSDIN
jgi:hypothetical protein